VLSATAARDRLDEQIAVVATSARFANPVDRLGGSQNACHRLAGAVNLRRAGGIRGSAKPLGFRARASAIVLVNSY
jgi:hypothetical protein